MNMQELSNQNSLLYKSSLTMIDLLFISWKHSCVKQKEQLLSSTTYLTTTHPRLAETISFWCSWLQKYKSQFLFKGTKMQMK